MTSSLKNLPPKKAISIVGGAFAVVAGLRDLRKGSTSGRLGTVHTVLKIVVALVGVVVALRAVDEIAEDA
jgi:hypothetical protein